MSGSNNKVFFRFQGMKPTNDAVGIPSVDISIQQTALEAKGDSLLARLADDTWKSDSTLGTTAEHPIVTPLEEVPCREEWSTSMAGMIENAYEWFSHQLHPTETHGGAPVLLKLPPGVELEDALVVLDYYGLLPEDPNSIQLDEAEDAVRLRARLFLQQVTLVEKAKDFIFRHLDQHPAVETLFLFAPAGYSMEKINERGRNSIPTVTDSYVRHKSEINTRRVGNIFPQFVRVGDESSCGDFFDMILSPLLRQRLVSLLEEEVGLEAESVTGDEGCIAEYLWWNESGLRPAEGFSLVAYDDPDDDVYELTAANMGVLRVLIPQASKKRCKEK